MSMGDLQKYLQQLVDPDETTRIAAYQGLKPILDEARASGTVKQFCAP